MTASRAEPASTSAGSGPALMAGALSYFIWGFVPLVFQAIGRLGVGPWEILAQRVAWSVPAATVLVMAAGQGRQALAVLRRPKVLAWLAVSALLIAVNWVVFISAVNSSRLLETSLGYYINPLLNMAAGALLFRERIDRVGQLAIGLALVGVVLQTVALGHLPLVSLALALTFCGYGIVRKQVAADAQTGLLIESLLLALPGLAFILWLHARGAGHFTAGPATALWLMATGPITAVPLVLFAWAARRVPLSAMGFLQFLGPTIGFAIGLAQGEAFGALRALSFVFIWGGAAVFIYGAWRRTRRIVRAAPEPAPAE